MAVLAGRMNEVMINQPATCRRCDAVLTSLAEQNAQECFSIMNCRARRINVVGSIDSGSRPTIVQFLKAGKGRFYAEVPCGQTYTVPEDMVIVSAAIDTAGGYFTWDPSGTAVDRLIKAGTILSVDYRTHQMMINHLNSYSGVIFSAGRMCKHEAVTLNGKCTYCGVDVGIWAAPPEAQPQEAQPKTLNHAAADIHDVDAASLLACFRNTTVTVATATTAESAADVLQRADVNSRFDAPGRKWVKTIGESVSGIRRHLGADMERFVDATAGFDIKPAQSGVSIIASYVHPRSLKGRVNVAACHVDDPCGDDVAEG